VPKSPKVPAELTVLWYLSLDTAVMALGELADNLEDFTELCRHHVQSGQKKNRAHGRKPTVEDANVPNVRWGRNILVFNTLALAGSMSHHHPSVVTASQEYGGESK
jgi:hypothetical protein